MKIVEIYDNVVKHIVPFWQSKAEIPKDVTDIYYESPDEVQEGWLYDPESKTFSPPLERAQTEEPSDVFDLDI